MDASRTVNGRALCRAAAALALAGAAAAGARAAAADYQDDWGPAVGSPMPALAAPDQGGDERGLEDLAGANGLLLFVNRSADW